MIRAKDCKVSVWRKWFRKSAKARPNTFLAPAKNTILFKASVTWIHRPPCDGLQQRPMSMLRIATATSSHASSLEASSVFFVSESNLAQ